MSVEIRASWHTDEGGFLTVYVDGVRTEATIEWIDPGRGYQTSSWREHTESVLLDVDYSPAFRDDVVAARLEAEYSQYIEDDVDVQEMTRDEGEEPDFRFRVGYWRGDITTLADHEVHTMLTSSKEANQALGEYLIRRGYTTVHLEQWQPDIDQGPLNRGWGLYGHLHQEEGA